MADLLDLTGSNPTLKTGAIVERFRSHDEGRHLAKLASEAAPELDEGLEREFRDTVIKLEQMVDDQRFRELAAKARAGALTLAEEREFGNLVARPTPKESGVGAVRPPGRKAVFCYNGGLALALRQGDETG